MRNDGTVFTDRDVHRYLRIVGIKNPSGEWFRCKIEHVKAAVIAVRNGQLNEENRSLDFKMRPEQREAVEKTAAYFKSFRKENHNKPPHFLWNAKMRFGKTFAAYQLAMKMGWRRVLVLTFKPAVQTAWEEDLKCHVDFRGWQFIKPGGLSYEQADKKKPFVCFGSFQDYLGRNPSTGGIKTKNEWVHATQLGLRRSWMSTITAPGARTRRSCLRPRTRRKWSLEKARASKTSTKTSCRSRRMAISTCPARPFERSRRASSSRSRFSTGRIRMSSEPSRNGKGRITPTPRCPAWCC